MRRLQAPVALLWLLAGLTIALHYPGSQDSSPVVKTHASYPRSHLPQLAAPVARTEQAGLFEGAIDDDEQLARAVEIAALGGGGSTTAVVLVAVDGRRTTDYIVSALNTMHQLRQHGQDNVLLLTASQADCRFATSQEVVRVRVCAWSEQLASPSDWWMKHDASAGVVRMWFLRLHFFARILHVMPAVEVLMTDTDVCFYANPFKSLREMGKSVVLNGVPDALNIGLMYANKTRASPPHTFDLFNEIARRQAAFRLAGVNDKTVTGQNAQVFWDQALVNDVFHEWVAPGVTSYARSCWLGFGAKGQNHTCFSECCLTPHPFGLRPGQRDEAGSLAEFVHSTFRPHMQSIRGTMGTTFDSRPEIAVVGLGTCGNMDTLPMVHENQCHSKGVSKADWMREKQCWHEPLARLLK